MRNRLDRVHSLGSRLDIVDSTKRRLRAALETTRELEGQDFQNPDSSKALAVVQFLLQGHLKNVEKLNAKMAAMTIASSCTAAASALWGCVPLLGFISRSTDTRNAFEIYGPLRRIAHRLVGHDARLVLSSEWDYSPYVYPEPQHLPGFVLIGFPATEASNPLLLPLAGHELGHAVFRRLAIQRKVNNRLDTELRDLIAEKYLLRYQQFVSTATKDEIKKRLQKDQHWQPAWKWATKQAEESFCDFLGLRLFGEPFLLAFAYLLAPTVEAERSLRYPKLSTRVINHISAATQYGYAVPTGYAAAFQDQLAPHLDDFSEFLLQLADEAVARIIPDLIKEADEVVKRSGVVVRTSDEVSKIAKGLKTVVPASKPISLADILAAGWEVREDPSLWKGHPAAEHRDRVLADLILKSIEVLDFLQLQGGRCC